MREILAEIKEKLKGKFIVFDGPDGSGKSTQIKLLADYLEGLNIDVVNTHDPGGTVIGDQIRRLLKYDAKGKMDVTTETFLFMASRSQLVQEVIKPAKENGKVILCDRYISATCAYQGAGGYSVDEIITLGKLAIGDIWPNLTIILDISPEEGRARTGQQKNQKTKDKHKDAQQLHLISNVIPDRFDSRPLDYHRKVRKEFLKLKEYYPSRIEIVDVSNSDEISVQEKILNLLMETDF